MKVYNDKNKCVMVFSKLFSAVELNFFCGRGNTSFAVLNATDCMNERSELKLSVNSLFLLLVSSCKKKYKIIFG